MTDLKDLKERLVQELKIEIAKSNGKEMTPACLDNIYKFIESIKGICKIHMLEEAEEAEEGYSRSQRNYSGRSYYSRHSRVDRLEEELERLIDEAPNDRVRNAIERALNELR